MEANRMHRRRSTFFEDKPTMKRVLILFAVLHIFMVSCALVFSKLEGSGFSSQSTPLVAMQLEIHKEFNLTMEKSVNLTMRVLSAARISHQMYVQESWHQFTTSFWFVTTLFTTVGTGHVVPYTFEGRLFSIISALVGIPLYALFLKHAGDCISTFNRFSIRHLEHFIYRKQFVRRRNIKCFIFALIETTAIILIGALASKAFGWTYFEGVYFCFISLSTVGFGDLVPDTSRPETKMYGIIYMFYNIIGLSIVSCLISSMVKAMDDVESMKKAALATSASIKRRLFQGSINITKSDTNRRFSNRGTFRATVKNNLYASEDSKCTDKDTHLNGLSQQSPKDDSI